MEGTVFNIQKFSIHDGPGIRTTVFLKGCPLHCPWCANVESQDPHIQLIWDSEKCIGCGKCIDLGLEDKLRFEKSSTFANKNGEKLFLCDTTLEHAAQYKAVCPSYALSFEGNTMDAQSVIDEVLKDKDFYEQSGGGLTLSGGEILMQPDFTCELLKLAHDSGIHTAAETTCFASGDVFERIVENLDLLLCDIKHWDSEKHKAVVGVGLEKIYKNIRYATGKEDLVVIGRVPVIPGFNYSTEDAHMLSQALIDLGIRKVELLPYHNFGENKYRLLTKKYSYEGVASVHKDDPAFVEYRKIFVEHGLDVL